MAKGEQNRTMNNEHSHVCGIKELYTEEKMYFCHALFVCYCEAYCDMRIAHVFR